MPPLIAINTTAGTGSELSGGCVITNTTTHVKMAIIDVHAVPTVGINDPLLMVGMPPALTASTGMDAMTHAVEGYVANFANPLTECLDLQAIRLVNDYLPAAVANGQNVVARDKMAYAEWIAGSTMCNAGLGLVHGMAHQLGGFYNLPHGVCNAILLPVVCDFNLIACPQRFADIAVALHQDITGLDAFEAGQKGIAAIRRLSKSIGIPASLSELGPVKESDFETLAPNALKDVCTFFNPRVATLKEVVGMYKAAM
jgi:alcohol dehydrogenase